MSTIVELFNEHSARYPARIAVRHEDALLTYEQLRRKSDQLAQFLLGRELLPDTPIAIVLGHGPAAVIAIWGVLKAGGAFVPVDPELPRDRIAFILEDTGCPVLLSDQRTAAQLPQGKVTRILLDTDWPVIDSEPVVLPPRLPEPVNLAYILYTSGSTGQPKGVMIEHRQVLAYLQDIRQRFDTDVCDNYAIVGTLAADAAYTAFFLAHCFGKPLYFYNLKNLTGFSALVECFERHPVDCYKITPSLLRLLLANKDAGKILPKKRLILGGESCPADLAREVLPLLREGCLLFNHYGPTETTIGVITYAFPAYAHEVPDNIPLGKPLPQVRLHILSDDGNAVAPGEKGELYIEGALVGRGYWKRPGLTRERFIQPASPGASRRYRTGDIVRSTPDNNIEFFGRVDHQIKLNGNRIEPKEIETGILQSGLVSRCAVTIKGTCLVAYITPAGGFTRKRLRAALRKKLPDYMIPSRYIELETWPINFNNKTDYAALPEPETVSAPGANKKTSDPLKKELIDSWREILAVDRVRTSDNFFELGGTSLSLIRLAFTLSTRLHLEVSALELITRLTLKEQYDHLFSKDSRQHPESNLDLPEFDPEEATLSQRNFFIQNRLNPSLTFPYSSVTFRVSGEIDLPALEAAFRELVVLHDSLRMSFGFKKGKVAMTIHPDITVAVGQHKSEGTDIDPVIASLIQPFDLTCPPLVRLFLITLADSRRFLHLYLPHINSDGESLNIIMETLETLYNGAIPEKATPQFLDARRKTHLYLGSPQFRSDEAFWRQRLGIDINPPLPTRIGTVPGKYAGIGTILYFSDTQRTAIAAFARSMGLTQFQLLLAAWVLLLYSLTKTNRLIVMLPVHNRIDQGMEKVIGLLANVILLDVTIDPKTTWRDFLYLCSDILLSTFSHQQFPFEKLLKIWTDEGRPVEKLLNFFFSYHYSRGEYRFGQATLDLHIPIRDKENLPLSAAIFETENRLTLRLAATAGYYGRRELDLLGTNYRNILSRLLADSGEETLSTLTNYDPYGKAILV